MKRQFSLLAAAAALAMLAAHSTAAPVSSNRSLPNATSLALAAPVQASRKIDPALSGVKGDGTIVVIGIVLIGAILAGAIFDRNRGG